MRLAHGLVAAVVALSALPPQGAPRVMHLGKVTAAPDQEFTGIEGVRELADGRVIVIDAHEKTIHVINPRTGADSPIGREGDGPGEFRLPLEIWPIGRDSSVVHDLARFGKLMAITSEPQTGGFVSMLDSAFSTHNFIPVGTDTAGRFYGLENAANRTDSARIVRWDMARQRRDTVARFTSVVASARPAENSFVVSADGRMIGFRSQPFLARNQWAVAADGRVAIVGADPYRVTYVAPDGRRTVGPDVAYRPVRVTDADKRAWTADSAKPVPMVTVQRGGGVGAGYRKGPPQVMADEDWPEAFPPFLAKAVRFATDGTLWVKRATNAGTPERYDVFDKAARRAFQVELPAARTLVGFGNGTVYLARVDDDDLHYLERYALPELR